MINNTKAFGNLKKEQQKILDFAVLICHSVPNLKKTISGEQKKVQHFSVPKPDYFKKEDNHRILELSKNYKSNLSKYLIISGYSFFEAYFRDVIKELIEFHGGIENYVQYSYSNHLSRIPTSDKNILKSKRKLQEPNKKKNKEKYNKYIRVLESENSFKMPSELLSTWGLKSLLEYCDSENFRSYKIPEIMELGFLMDLSEKFNKHPDLIDKDLRKTFDMLRDTRNNISHGGVTKIGFPKAMDYLRFLRRLSVKFDQHLIDNFFIQEIKK
tara:strand:+ start:210 stop:1019 length:810 start_codon:yes stop_codon:yes gene_type:complete